MIISLVALTIASFTDSGFFECLALWGYASKDDGGFGFDPEHLGGTFTVTALLLVFT